MSRSLPPLNALRAFEAAGRHGSFSSAAAELGVSHSSISRHVRGLELRLGVNLFRTVAGGVELSPEGRAYLGQVSPAFDVLADATETLTGRAPGVITINCEPTFAMHWLIPRLGTFLAAFPNVEPRITASYTLANLTAFEADVAIRSVVRTVPDVPAALVSNAPMYPFARPEICAGVTEPSDLLRLPRLQDRRGNPWYDWFNAAGVDADGLEAPDWRMRADVALPAAVAGQGVMLVSADLAEVHVARGDLARAWDVPLWGGCYMALVEPQAARRRAVRDFRDWVTAEGAPWQSPEGPGYGG
ncbi:LysR substrate-binding domain-containing protein [Sagittula stellata]|uniref:Transcriptional Regulator, LysR family protein n=1 Tax=Sagittula stellata (strain ATCC 700073 / DSM 11524 / E-37) TaxID=388399 RepID=A3K9D9_SAGS3|nr:LysR substrate-binding domain-containing protein [Sagittula stellata]EBA06311.1 Transcriptional Regulator, LysR family protein [Sagittula stellata E-37]